MQNYPSIIPFIQAYLDHCIRFSFSSRHLSISFQCDHEFLYKSLLVIWIEKNRQLLPAFHAVLERADSCSSVFLLSCKSLLGSLCLAEIGNKVIVSTQEFCRMWCLPYLPSVT